MIFEHHRRATDQPREGSLGLGLAIVRELAKALDHSVSVRSVVGKGSVFSVEVPIVPADATGYPPPRPSIRSHAGHPAVILLLESDSALRESLESLFKSAGFEVAAVTDAQAALLRVREGGLRPHLVISDYNLSRGINGVRAADALREALGSDLPVLILTGDVRVAALREIAAHGCLGRKKPVDGAQLVREARSLLETFQPPAVTTGAPFAPAGPAVAASEATIFVVDDDRGARQAMELVLTKAGYSVRTFASGTSFLESYRPGQRGCLIIDVIMPGMNGFELLARLAAAGQAPPAILITGQGDIAQAVAAMKAGAVDFIEKPTDPDALLASVDRALRQAASPAQLSTWRKAAALRVAGLTKRERDVLNLVIAGATNKDISARLRIHRRTVETHRAAVMSKMGASSHSELIRLALAAGLGEDLGR